MRPKHPLRLSLRKVTRLRTPLHLLRLKINQIMCCGQPKAANVLKVEASEWAVSTVEQFRAAGCGHCPGGAAAYDFVAPPFAQQLIILSWVVAFEAIECVVRRLNGG